MKPLLRVFLVMASCFAATFLAIQFTGLLTAERIEDWMMQARELSPVHVGSVVALLLFADLFIAIPTMTVTILSGFFLGHGPGAAAAFTGIFLAGICGYALGQFCGDSVLRFLLREESKRNEAIHTFQKHGVAVILLSRAMPILPEVSACLSGMTRLPFWRFLTAWLISSVPYIWIASYAGSISSVEDPKPAIFAAIGLSGFFWLAWFAYRHLHMRKSV